VGYYIDFVFDTDLVLTWQQAVRRFEEVGAEIRYDPTHPNAEKFVNLVHPKIPFSITINKLIPVIINGHWADVRFSWGQDPKMMYEDIKAILEIADSVGCRVYDGQIQQYINYDNIGEIISCIRKASRNVIGFIGKTALDNNISKNDWIQQQIEKARDEHAQELDLVYSEIDSIPSEIGQLTELEKLRLNGNNLTSVPPEIGRLKNLKYLSLSDNKLLSLPSGIFELSELERLDISFNKLTMLDPRIAQLTNLEQLNLYNNRLVSLCTEICQLEHLRNLDLSANLIKNLPVDFAELNSLKSLKLSRNRLNTFPSQICELDNLTVLYLDGNNLSSIPQNIGKLILLETLRFHLNPLTSLPREIRNLVCLNSLTIPRFGPFSNIPAEMDLERPSKVLDYIFEIMNDSDTAGNNQ
jgi:Leucine-rich repeat (LRR) protein